jgi:hypothetical protein
VVPVWAFWMPTRARGNPVSWPAYMYGMAHLGRAAARESLRMADAVAIAHTPERAAWERWSTEMTDAAR